MTKTWNLLSSFWEKQPPLKGLAVFRIFLASLLIRDLLSWGNQSAIFFSSEGLLSLESLQKSPGLSFFSIFRFIPDSPVFILGVGGVLFLALIGVLLGVALPVSALVSWLIMMSLRNRDPFIFTGGHQLSIVFLFLLSFSAADRRWSLRPKGKGDELHFFHSVSFRLMQIQVCVLYLSAFLNKAEGEYWRDGTFLFYLGQQTEILRPWATGLFENPWIVAFLTYATMIIEFVLVGLLFFRGRFKFIVLAVGPLFHLALEATLTIALFQWTMLCSLLLFLEDKEIENFQQKFLRRKK